MPNGTGDRWRDEEQYIIDPLKKRGWEYLEDPPNWVQNAVGENIRGHVGTEYKYTHLHGDTFIYKVTSTVHGRSIHVFRMLKSKYYQTTPEEGTCPNCQSYVKRYEDDDYLTCHRCGWQYKPFRERLKNLFS